MKIGIDARLYGTKNRGLGRYVQKLVDGLLKYDQKNQFVIFLLPENIEALKTDNPRVKKVLLPVKWYGLAEQFVALKTVKREKLDLMHWPHLNVPYFFNQKYILTVHDLIINHFPDSRATTLPLWLYRLKLAGYYKVLKHAIARAEKIIAPSNYVKQDLLANYPASAGKVEIIYEGYFLDTVYQPQTIERFKITKPFLFYVGSAYPHKNLSSLVKVFKSINKTKKYQLVLSGAMDYFYRRLSRETQNDPDIVFTGFVSESELSSLYQKSLLYVFPSKYEGFGLPPLEAQAQSCPVVSSNAASLPEVLGDSALFFDPSNETDMEDKIKLLLENGQLREKLITLGLKNIDRFSWEKMVKQTLDLYLS